MLSIQGDSDEKPFNPVDTKLAQFKSRTKYNMSHTCLDLTQKRLGVLDARLFRHVQ